MRNAQYTCVSNVKENNVCKPSFAALGNVLVRAVCKIQLQCPNTKWTLCQFSNKVTTVNLSHLEAGMRNTIILQCCNNYIVLLITNISRLAICNSHLCIQQSSLERRRTEYNDGNSPHRDISTCLLCQQSPFKQPASFFSTSYFHIQRPEQTATCT